MTGRKTEKKKRKLKAEKRKLLSEWESLYFFNHVKTIMYV